MVKKSNRNLDKRILNLLKTRSLKDLYLRISSDPEIKTLTKMANKVTMKRLDLNDHGPTHSKIVTLYSLKILELLKKEKIKPTIVQEGWGNLKDSKAALILSAYIHDIGCTISREDHDRLGLHLAVPIAKRILKEYNPKKGTKLLPFVLEGIFCHLGKYKSTSVEGGIISVADGCDMKKGRSRMPFNIGKRDIHEYSTKAIDKVTIKKGKNKPILIKIKMNSTAGVFQVEKILLEKIKNSSIKKYITVISIVKEGKKIYHDVEI